MLGELLFGQHPRVAQLAKHLELDANLLEGRVRLLDAGRDAAA